MNSSIFLYRVMYVLSWISIYRIVEFYSKKYLLFLPNYIYIYIILLLYYRENECFYFVGEVMQRINDRKWSTKPLAYSYTGTFTLTVIGQNKSPTQFFRFPYKSLEITLFKN